MYRIFVVECCSDIKVMSQEEFKGFIATAVFHNRDIGTFKVTEIDFKLNLSQAIILSTKMGYASIFASEYTSLKDVESAFRNMLKIVGKLKNIC